MASTGALLMAAGQSSRFNSHKLLHPMPDGRPLILHSLRPLLASGLSITAVVKPLDTELHQLFARHRIPFLIYERAEEGLGSSIAFGVKQRSHWSGWLIALADMPFILPTTITSLVAQLTKDTIIRPVCRHQQGHPVAFGKTYYSELTRLKTDKGAASIIQQHPDQLRLLSVADHGTIHDIDRPDDLTGKRTQSLILKSHGRMVRSL